MRLVLVAALVLSSVSFAQTNAGEQKRRGPVSEVKFGEGDVIDGDLKSPDVNIVYGKDPAKFDSMIKVRKNFSDKLMQSVNDLH